MSYVVMESYSTTADKMPLFRKIALDSLEIFETLEGLEKMELIEDSENSTIIGHSYWKSKETFNDFLKSPIMMELLESPQMQTMKEIMTDYEIKFYTTLKREQK